MTELMRNFTGHMAGILFENAVIYLEDVKTSGNGKLFLFAIEPHSVNLLNGDAIYRFAHHVDDSILKFEFGDKSDNEISSEIIYSLTAL
ncbi:TPA: hypothetical protein OMF84_004504 [Klebsiella michiganensis]|nr:hypothetical protein [Klebsiella michiganensis]